MIAYFTVLSLLVVAYLLNEACIHSADHQREPFVKTVTLNCFFCGYSLLFVYINSHVLPQILFKVFGVVLPLPVSLSSSYDYFASLVGFLLLLHLVGWNSCYCLACQYFLGNISALLDLFSEFIKLLACGFYLRLHVESITHIGWLDLFSKLFTCFPHRIGIVQL